MIGRTAIETETLTVEEYQSLLSSNAVAAVYTKRDNLDWLTQISPAIEDLGRKDPIQVWLINEPLINAEERLRNEFKRAGIEDTQTNQIVQDISSLCDFFVQMTGDANAFFSFRSIDERYFEKNPNKSVSKHWHVDSSVLTLSCCYTGKGTEWIEDDEDIRRLFLQEKITDQEIDYANREFHQMSPGEVSVIKGELRSHEDANSREFLSNFLPPDQTNVFNEHRGLIHRGPGYEHGDSVRLLLTLSTMKIPSWLESNHT